MSTTVLTMGASGYFSAAGLGHKLGSVAYSKQGNLSIKLRQIGIGCCLFEGGIRRPTKDDGLKLLLPIAWDVVKGMDFAINVELSYPARNELGVLRAKIKN
jgi:hypothetical protein